MVSDFMQFTGKCLMIVPIVALVVVLSVAEILIAPQDTEAVIEETVKLHCKGTLGNIIEWHHVAVGERYSKLVYQSGFIYNGYRERFEAERTNDGGCTLLINRVKPADAGKYICLENSEIPIKVTAELIVFERFPSNGCCAGRYTCKPICNELELLCEMKAYGNYIPSMQWIDNGGKSINATNSIVNEMTVSIVKLKSDPYKEVLYTCQMQYLKIPLKSKYDWTYSTTELARESSSKLLNPGDQPPPDPTCTSSVLIVIITTSITLVIAFFIGISSVLITRMYMMRKFRESRTEEESAAESEYLHKKRKGFNSKAAKRIFIPCTTVNKGNPIHGLAAIDNEVFITTRDGCVVEVFDINRGGLKRFWSVDGLVNPNYMASCPNKKIIFICDWKKTADDRDIFCLDIDGRLLCRWSSEHSRGCISITKESNVIVVNSWYNTLQEYTCNGTLIKKIIPGNDKLHLWHAIKLDNGNFVACFGDVGDDHQEICILDKEGRVLNSVRSDSNLFHQKPPSVPRSLAADKNGNIYVCDLHNFRIIVLNPELKLKRYLDTTSDGHKLRGPLRICVNDFKNEDWLLVADNVKEAEGEGIRKKWRNGRVTAWNLKNVLRETASEV